MVCICGDCPDPVLKLEAAIAVPRERCRADHNSETAGKLKDVDASPVVTFLGRATGGRYAQAFAYRADLPRLKPKAGAAPRQWHIHPLSFCPCPLALNKVYLPRFTFLQRLSTSMQYEEVCSAFLFDHGTCACLETYVPCRELQHLLQAR